MYFFNATLNLRAYVAKKYTFYLVFFIAIITPKHKEFYIKF